MPSIHNAELATNDNRHLAEQVGQRLCEATVCRDGFDGDAVAAIVDEAKQQGLIDHAIATSAIVFFCQSLSLGAHTLERWGGGGGGRSMECSDGEDS